MSAVGFLLIAVVIAACGSLALYVSQRPSTSVHDGVESFRKGLNALGDARQSEPPRHRQTNPTSGEWSRQQES